MFVNPMTQVFTICLNNSLAMVRILTDSIWILFKRPKHADFLTGDQERH